MPKFVLIDEKSGKRNELVEGNFKTTNFSLLIKADKVMLLKPTAEVDVFINSFHFPENQAYQQLKNGDFIEAGTEVFKIELSEPTLDSESATLPEDAAASHANSKSVYTPKVYLKKEELERNESISDNLGIEKAYKNHEQKKTKSGALKYVLLIAVLASAALLIFITKKS